MTTVYYWSGPRCRECRDVIGPELVAEYGELEIRPALCAQCFTIVERDGWLDAYSVAHGGLRP